MSTKSTMSANPYTVLSLPSSATGAEIKARYRALILSSHPDKGGSASSFIKIQEAYELLIDPARKAAWDADATDRDAQRQRKRQREDEAEAYRTYRRRKAEAEMRRQAADEAAMRKRAAEDAARRRRRSAEAALRRMHVENEEARKCAEEDRLMRAEIEAVKARWAERRRRRRLEEERAKLCEEEMKRSEELFAGLYAHTDILMAEALRHLQARMAAAHR